MFNSGVRKQITVRGFNNDESLEDIFENDVSSFRSSKFNFGAAAARAARNHSSFHDSQKTPKSKGPMKRASKNSKGSEINIARTFTRRSNYETFRRGSNQPTRMQPRLEAVVPAQRSVAMLNDVRIEDVDKTIKAD